MWIILQINKDRLGRESIKKRKISPDNAPFKKTGKSSTLLKYNIGHYKPKSNHKEATVLEQYTNNAHEFRSGTQIKKIL